MISKNKFENIFSAPIAGYTNWPMRQLFNEYKASRIFSEMVHVREILYRNIEDIPLIKEAYNFTIQLFGSFDDDFINAGNVALRFCDDIDLNCGCPVKKVIKAKGGVFWLSDIEKFSKKIDEISSAFPYKVSVKIRLGFNKPQVLEIIDSIKNSKISFLTIHMRIGSMLFSGKALYNYAKLLEGYNVPIILNGDINTPEYAKNILDSYPCKGIMIGRTSLQDPSIFSQINSYLKTGFYLKPNPIDRINNCIKYLNYLIQYINGYGKKTSNINVFKRKSIIESRKILFSLSKNIPFANTIRDNMLKINSEEDLKDLKNVLSNLKSSNKYLKS